MVGVLCQEKIKQKWVVQKMAVVLFWFQLGSWLFGFPTQVEPQGPSNNKRGTKPQLPSDPGKKGTLFGEDHFWWASHQQKRKKGATEQLRNQNQKEAAQRLALTWKLHPVPSCLHRHSRR